MHNPLTRLHRLIVNHYNLQELKTLCFDLGVSYDALPGEGTAAQARELALHLGHRRRFDELLAELKRGRPEAFDEMGLGVGPDTLQALYEALPASEASGQQGPEYQVDARGSQAAVMGDHAHIEGGVHYYAPPTPKAAPDAYTPPPPPDPDPDPDKLPAPGKLPPGSWLPFTRNKLFTDRAESLTRLAQTLLHEHAPATLVTQSILGMGGIGKTQLAVEFAYRYGRYFHGVHWLNAAQPETLTAEVAACGARMNLANWPDEQPKQVERTLDEWRRDGRRLVVLDNLENVAAAREWLKRLGGEPVRVMVTARRGQWPRDLGLEALRLEVFEPWESREFLRLYLDERRATDEALDALAGRLGHLPLALELAGRYLDIQPLLSVSAYIGKLDDIFSHRSMRGGDKHGRDSPTGHDLSIMSTFDLSWEQVSDEAARRLFVLASYCAPNQPIPGELLAQASGLDVEDYGLALTSLKRLGLLSEELAPDTWETPGPLPSIHPLLAEYGQYQELEADPLQSLVKALVRLAKAANDQMDQSGSPAHFEPLLPHLRLLAGSAESKAAADAAHLLVNLGYYLHRVAGYSGARAAYERALAIQEGLYEPDDSNIAITVNNLGSVLQDLGDLAGARAAYERALAIDEAVYGPNHPNVAIRVNNLGLVLKDLGDLAGARAAYERALAIDEAVYGPDHPNVARDVNNLGSVLQDLGDLAGARAALQRALAIFERFLPPEHPNIRIARGNLAGLGSGE